MARLLEVLGWEASPSQVRALAQRSDIPLDRLKHYVRHDMLPPSPDLERLCAATGKTPAYVRIALGKIDQETADLLAANYQAIWAALGNGQAPPARRSKLPAPDFKTKHGRLFQGDSIALLASTPDESVDMVFADPPFNLNKLYPSKIDDDIKAGKYLHWTEQWIHECVRVLKPGGSLFVWNLPKWNVHIAALLNQSMTLRHWIAVDMKNNLPIPGRLYPSHYSLLYYCKGPVPTTFHPDRMPMEICPHCYDDLRDYGGYKAKMNPLGVNLTDVWFDIQPVRHAKYKKRKDANELSLRLMDRVIELSTDRGDVILDPFGGSGTTYVAAELKGRKWIGMEIGPLDGIVERLQNMEEERTYLDKIRQDYNALFSKQNQREREKRGLWTCESVRHRESAASRQKTLRLEA